MRRVAASSAAAKWRLHVLDLRTGIDVELAENRSVDDQVEWLDNTTLLYSVPREAAGAFVDDTYAVPADGTGTPKIYVSGARSPAVSGRTS